MTKLTMNSFHSVFTILIVIPSSAIAATDSPFIVAHEKATLNRLKSGFEKVSVSIDISIDIKSDRSWPWLVTEDTSDLLGLVSDKTC
ncbi:hypothetical protein Tco_0630658 [Tanacetum coccineum]